MFKITVLIGLAAQGGLAILEIADHQKTLVPAFEGDDVFRSPDKLESYLETDGIPIEGIIQINQLTGNNSRWNLDPFAGLPH